MPPRKKKKRKAWTRADLKQLSKLAGRLSTRRIARQLKRTEGAVRFKAHTHRIRLRLERRRA